MKITVDAYDGTTQFYVADATDPIIRAYQGVFPTLFKPMDQMPADLGDHLRVPEELFNVQTRVFGRYHVTNAQQFFRNDDLWTVPTGQASDQTLPSEAYYVVMRMPGEEQRRVPAAAAHGADQPAEHDRLGRGPRWMPRTTGRPRVYRFPADTTVFGPAQIEARIDQDPIISQQVSLWNQSGSEVIRGNLIVVPLGESFDLPPAGLPAIDRGLVPGVPAHRRGLDAERRLGSDPRRRHQPAAASRGGQLGTDPDAVTVTRCVTVTRRVAGARRVAHADTDERARRAAPG